MQDGGQLGRPFLAALRPDVRWQPLAGLAHQVLAHAQQLPFPSHPRLPGAGWPGRAGARWRRAEACASSSLAIRMPSLVNW